VPEEGFEPPRPKALVSKTSASANSTTGAQKIKAVLVNARRYAPWSRRPSDSESFAPYQSTRPDDRELPWTVYDSVATTSNLAGAAGFEPASYSLTGRRITVDTTPQQKLGRGTRIRTWDLLFPKQAGTARLPHSSTENYTVPIGFPTVIGQNLVRGYRVRSNPSERLAASTEVESSASVLPFTPFRTVRSAAVG
jgi:hypothetical protein